MIRLKHDLDADALYVTLADGSVARTLEVNSDPGTMVDLDADGKLIGIEVISPDRMWPLHKILAGYDIGDSDAAMLMATYPTSARAL